MSAAVTYPKSSDKLIPRQGQKLRSHIHRLDQNSVTALSGYSVSINTSTQNWHPQSSTTNAERIKESTKALKLQHLAIQPKSESDNNDKEITFYLPKEQGNYRAEISNFRPIKVTAASIYSFDFKATSLPDNLVLFQVRELGGSMKLLGGDRPSFSLHIKQDGMLVAATNTVNQNGNPIGPEGKTYTSKNIALKKIELGAYCQLTIEMVMHREHPSIKITINDEIIYHRDSPFGASDSKTFYSKLGAYVPQQKNKTGTNDSKVSFDNIEESHHQYAPPAMTEENNVFPAGSDTHNALSDAMTTFSAKQNHSINVRRPNIGEELLVLGTAIMIPHQIF
ncbi:hypothetical protein [Yersinia mollaretii]|uniref:hypothetical protein n=1 Tax=Yersinia mollaretii TaxID=33060 RepID=UPI0011A86D9F|nr:hypothetical protein [Yersinia mollaretii]MDN0110864.1 hypothetical protein [Yersinia mollaretii]